MPLLLLFAILAGVALPVQAGVNAGLRTSLGHPLAAALVSFFIGLAALLLLVLGMRVPLGLDGAWARAPWWHWIGGLIGAVYVAASVVLAPRLGAATLVAAIVAGQMVSSLILDQYGLIGFEQHPISLARLAGAALVIGGVVLIQR